MRVFLQDCIKTVIDNRGVTPHKRGTEWQDSGIMVLSANNVKTSGLQNMDQVRFISEEVYSSWMKIPLEKGDLILTSEAPAGEVYYWDSDEKVVLGQRLYGLKIKESINSKYLKYYLQSNVGQKAIRQQQSGSTVFGISATTFQSIVVELPERDIQDNIANILSDIDAKIDNNNAIAAELEGMAKDLYDYWFVQFDFPDENGKPYKSSGGKMVWNEELKREIPEGWEISKASALLDVTRGISYSAKDLLGKGVAMINLNTFNTDSTFKKNGMKTYSGKYSDEKKVQPYDLLMCVTQQTDIDMTGRSNVIGKTFLMPNLGFDNDVVMSMDVAKLSCPSRWWLPFFHYLFQTFYAHRFITGYANGTKIKHLDVEAALNVPFVKASDSLVKQYANIALSISEKQSTIILENMELASLRDFLLPMLMNGQVKVKGA